MLRIMLRQRAWDGITKPFNLPAAVRSSHDSAQPRGFSAVTKGHVLPDIDLSHYDLSAASPSKAIDGNVHASQVHLADDFGLSELSPKMGRVM